MYEHTNVWYTKGSETILMCTILMEVCVYVKHNELHVDQSLLFVDITSRG